MTGIGRVDERRNSAGHTVVAQHHGPQIETHPVWRRELGTQIFVDLDFFVDEFEVPGVEFRSLLKHRGCHRHRPERRYTQKRWIGWLGGGLVRHCVFLSGSDYQFCSVAPSSVRRHVCRAIIKSSLVGMTQAEVLLLGVVILAAPAVFAASSNSMPSHSAWLHARRRISGACAPIPAVKTSASRPPRLAASDPNSRPIR